MKIIEPDFDFLVNNKDELMLVIEGKKNPPENPTFSFNATDTAAIFRDSKQTIKLVKIPTEIIKMLNEIKTFSITEIDKDGELLRNYDVKVDIDKDLKKKLMK